MKKTLTLKGFTLIEMGIVIVAISILTGIIVPTLQGYIEDSEKASDYANAALIYNDVSLIIAADDNAYLSFFSGEYDGTSGKTCQYPVAKMVKRKDGEGYVQEWTKNTSYTTSIITRCSGVDYRTMIALAERQGQGYNKQKEAKELTGKDGWHGLHDHFNDGTSILFTWEPVASNKTMNKNDILEKVTHNKFGWDNGSQKDSNKYFTLLLCEKENLPLWSDYVSGTTSNNKAVTSKVPIQMRYNKGNTNPDKGQTKVDGVVVNYDFSNSDYVWEWMITYNPNTLQPEIWAGNGQGNLVRRVYPDVDTTDVIYKW